MTAAAATRVDRPTYDWSTRVLAVIVDGDPKPQGSKSGFVNPKTGKVNMVESSKLLKPWRSKVRKAIQDAIAATPPPADGWPLIGPLALHLVFTMPKPKAAPKTRQTWPTVYPDIDKLTRAVLDAGKLAGLYLDDAQVVDCHTAKAYPREAPGTLAQPGLFAVVYTVGPATIPPGRQDALL